MERRRAYIHLKEGGASMGEEQPISTHRFDRGHLVRAAIREGEYVEWLDAPINIESCVAGFVEFRPNGLAGSFVIYYDEIQYGLSGEADLIYRLPPIYDREFTTRVAAGDLYFLPIGTEVRYDVIGPDPYVIMYAVMPRPKYFGQEKQWQSAPHK
jgi:hypothetical protein